MANEFSLFLAITQSTRSRWAVSSATPVSPSNNSASYSSRRRTWRCTGRAEQRHVALLAAYRRTCELARSAFIRRSNPIHERSDLRVIGSDDALDALVDRVGLEVDRWKKGELRPRGGAHETSGL